MKENNTSTKGRTWRSFFSKENLMAVIKSPRLWLSILATALMAIIAAKGDKISMMFSAWTVTWSALNWNMIGIVFGMVMAVVTYLTTIAFKLAHYRLAQKAAEKGLALDVAEDSQ